MTVTAATVRDLLLPGIAGLEARFGGRVKGDIQFDENGDLWLELVNGSRRVRTVMATSMAIESGSYKNTFGSKSMTAFDVFDQATKTELAPGESQVLCEADRAARVITFNVREGFGDGTDGCGVSLANPETAERDAATHTFLKAVDVIMGKRKSVVPVERWSRMRMKDTA